MPGTRGPVAILVAAFAAATAIGACQPAKPGAPAPAPPGSPAPSPTAPSGPALTVTTVLGGLDHPWEVAFAPDATMFFTERTGTINAIVDGARRTLASPTDVRVGGEGGMLGLAVDPDYESNRTIYTCFSSTLGAGGTDNRIVRWRVADDLSGLDDRVDIVTDIPYNTAANGRHSGCRLQFGPDGLLWAGTGDAARCEHPQDPDSLGGKVLRVGGAGDPAPGNPSEISIVYTLGHRNVQGLAFRPGTGQAYGVEHGPDRDDEVNRLLAGRNYGWDPCPGYDESVPMTFPGGEPAVWSSGFPTIAPSGATFLSGPQWGSWDGALAVAVLKDRHLRVMLLDPAGGITSTVVALAGSPRLRSAVLGPDANLYITTDVGNGGGEIRRVVPG